MLVSNSKATTPPGVNPSLGPDYSPTGQIMFYTLQSTNPLAIAIADE